MNAIASCLGLDLKFPYISLLIISDTLTQMNQCF